MRTAIICTALSLFVCDFSAGDEAVQKGIFGVIPGSQVEKYLTPTDEAFYAIGVFEIARGDITPPQPSRYFSSYYAEEKANCGISFVRAESPDYEFDDNVPQILLQYKEAIDDLTLQYLGAPEVRNTFYWPGEEIKELTQKDYSDLEASAFFYENGFFHQNWFFSEPRIVEQDQDGDRKTFDPKMRSYNNLFMSERRILRADIKAVTFHSSDTGRRGVVFIFRAWFMPDESCK